MKRILFCVTALFFCSQPESYATVDSLQYDKTSIRNLVAFSKVYGALRYFYPSEKMTKMDWERFIQEGIPKIATAKDEKGLIAALNDYCGSRDVFVSSDSAANSLVAGNGKFKYWRHKGFGASSDETVKGFFGFLYKIFGPYRSKIVSDKTGNNAPSPDSLYTYRLSEGVVLHMRHALYKNEKLPEEYEVLVKAFKRKKAKEKKERNEDVNIRVATAIYICNVLETFFPYPDFVSHDWDFLISRTLERAFTDTSNLQYLGTLNKLFSDLNDGHAGVMLTGDSSVYKPPLLFVLIDSTIIVRYCEHGDSLGIKAGDILLEVDGQDALEVLEKEESYWSSPSPAYKNYCSLTYSFLSGQKNSLVNLKFKSEDGITKTVTLKRTHYWVAPSKILPADTVFDSKIVYLKLSEAKGKVVKKTLSNLTAEQSLIIDNRGYPNQSIFFLTKLATEKKMESQKWLVPIYMYPFQQKMEYDTSNWEVRQSKKHIPDSCKVVFLTNYRAISASETLMSIVKYYKVGTIIGETTAATNGNIVTADFDGTFRFIFTGMKVINQDGSQFHGVGVAPDIEVKQTIEGIRAGRDEVLEYAIRYLKSN